MVLSATCRIPPYFALIIRAISVLEGIALVANPDFAIVDEVRWRACGSACTASWYDMQSCMASCAAT